MTDIMFNGKIRRTDLYRFRRAGALSTEFIAARSLTAAAALLKDLGVEPDEMTHVGALITPLRTDVE